MADTDPAVSIAFDVTIDDTGESHALGWFNSCEGLAVEVVMESREEGGNNAFVWQFPTRLKYANIKLTRAIGPDSAKLTAWLASMVNGPVQPKTAVIKAMTAQGTTVASWSLHGVLPVRWTGPNLNVETVKAATETLELSHHGFLPDPVPA